MFLDLLASIVALLLLTLEVSVVTSVVFLLTLPIYKFMQSKFEKNKFLQIALPYFVIIFLLVIIFYLVPYLATPSGVDLSDALQPNIFEIIQLYFIVVVGLIFKSICIAIIFSPFVFIAALIEESFKDRGKPFAYAAAIIITSFLFSSLITLLPWLLPGVIYLIYWG